MSQSDISAAISSSTMASSSSASSSSSLIQVITITVVALTSTFTPPPSCMESRLTQLSSPGYQIWLNEPNPVPSSKFGDCYPSPFIQGYTSIANASSSIAPMFSPLVCPSGWSTAQEWDNGYIACCASGFLFHPPDTPADTDRPGYGGTCYSNFAAGQTVNVTVYDSSSVTATASWIASATTDQAYAHPIDGYKVESVTAGSGDVQPDAQPDAPSDAPASARLSGGAIAGITIGAVAALFGLVLLFWLHRRKRQAAAVQQAKEASAHNAADSPGLASASAYGGSTTVGEQKELPMNPPDQSWAGTTPVSHEYGGSPNYMSPTHQGFDAPRYELGGPPLEEMDGGWRGNEMRG